MLAAMARAIVIATLEAPWGQLHLAATERGLAALDQLTPRPVFEAQLEARFGTPPVPLERLGPATAALPDAAACESAAAHLHAALDAVSRFIAGDLDALQRIPIDLEDRPGWDRLVLGAVREIPAGVTASYGRIARLVDRPGAARAVGGAVGRNPIGLVIPCHRIIAGDGTLGGYGGSWWGSRADRLDLKRTLLAREGVTVAG
jgi:methylated-DNA-[protein]-cysteine S-methyltransferase